MKTKTLLSFFVICLITGCNGSESKYEPRQDSAASAKMSLSVEIQARFSHPEILQELIDRREVRLYSNNYSRIRLNQDTLPKFKNQLQRVQQSNPNLKGYPTSALHLAYIESYDVVQTLYDPDGSDNNRLEYDDPAAIPYRKYANQVLGIIEKKGAVPGNNVIHLITKGPLTDFTKQLNSGVPLCKMEKYSAEQVVMTGTAFPIDGFTIITAAHCIDNDLNCTPEILKDLLNHYSFVFGYQQVSAPGTSQALATDISPENLYQGVSIINRPFNLDIAIIRVNKKIPDSLIPSIAGSIPLPTDPLFMVGYPIGISKKITINGKMRDPNYNKDSIYFYARLDAFKGNSGSPVFDQTGNQIIGLLVSGGQDFTAEDIQEKCSRYYNCRIVNAGDDATEGVCHGEKMINLVRVISDILTLVKNPDNFKIKI